MDITQNNSQFSNNDCYQPPANKTRRGVASDSLPNDAGFLTQLANCIPQLIWTNDGNGVANYFNNRWYEYTGRSHDESVGRGWQLVVHPGDATESDRKWQESLRNGETFEAEYRLQAANGEYHWFIGRNVPLRNESGDVIGWFGTATEIEELKSAQLSASQSEARLRATLEGAHDFAIITLDANGIIIGWNSGAERAFGYAEEEVVGSHGSILFTPEDRGAGIPELELEKALQFGRAEDERWHWHRNGSRFYMSGVMAPIYGTSHAGFVKVARDMTERREADEALRQSEARYRELAEDLSRAREALLSTDRQKDQFIATLAHELRNPLAPVRSAMELISLTGSQNPQVLWALDVVNRQMRTMTRLIDDLMDVSRISQNKLLLHADRVELGSALRDAIDSVHPQVEAQQQALSVNLPSQPLMLVGDQTRLSQIFANLLDNASKYTQVGGSISVTATVNKNAVTVRIADNGIGIAPDDLDKIFALFTQVRTSSDRGKGGLGIGLSLVQQLVHMHGGTVTVHSEGEGRGSEFVVTLPLAEFGGMPAAETPEFSSASLSFPGARVLVVDDNVDAADSLDALLTRLGATVRTAYDGPEALRLADEIIPDIVFLDIGLPGMSGHEVAARIRSQPWGEQVALVAISGWGSEQDKRDSHEVGFDRHIVKPAEPARLLQVMSELLAK